MARIWMGVTAGGSEVNNDKDRCSTEGQDTSKRMRIFMMSKVVGQAAGLYCDKGLLTTGWMVPGKTCAGRKTRQACIHKHVKQNCTVHHVLKNPTVASTLHI